MARGDLEVQHTALGPWRIVVQGQFKTQEEAEAAANALGRKLKVEVFIRGLLGRILRRNTYGYDPEDSVN